MLLLIIILALLFAGGGGYYGYSRWGMGGGLGISELSADCFGFVSARSCPLLQDELCIILSARSW